MTYFPHIITRQPPEWHTGKGSIIRPGEPRPKMLQIKQDHFSNGSRWERDVVQAHMGHNPDGPLLHNSAEFGSTSYPLHGYSAGADNIADAMVWDTELKRYVCDCSLLTANITFVDSIANHPLHFATVMSGGAWCYIPTTATNQVLFRMDRTTLPALLIGTDFANGARMRFFTCDNLGTWWDLYTNQGYLVAEWFYLSWSYAGGSGMAMAINGNSFTFSSHGGSIGINLGGTGSNSVVRTQNWGGKFADLVLRESNQNVNDAYNLWIQDTENTSVSGFVRGWEFDEDTSTPRPQHRAVISLPQTPGDRIVPNDEEPLIRDLRLYIPFERQQESKNQALSTRGQPAYDPIPPSDLVVNPKLVSWHDYGYGMRSYAANQYWQWTDDIWPTGDCCISFWVYASAVITGQAFGHASNPATAERFLCHCPWSDGSIYWDFGGSSSGTTRLTYNPGAGYMAQGRWEHFILSAVPGVGMAIFHNGRYVASHSGSTPTRTKATTKVSSLLGGYYRHEGAIAEFAVWDRDLSDGEKLDLYRNPLALRKRQIDNMPFERHVYARPAAPISNARTVAVRVPQLEDERPSHDEEWDVNTGSPLARGLKAWFEPSGSQAGSNLIDRARITPTMQYLAAAWTDTKTREDPVVGYYWRFDGTDDRATVEDSGNTHEIAFGIKPWSCEVLFRPDSASGGTQYILAHGNINTGFAPVLNFALRTEDAKLRFIYRNSANTVWYYTTTFSNLLTGGEWAHVIFWHNGGSTSSDYGFIFNGGAVVKSDTGTLNATPQTSNVPLKLATRYDTGTGTHGGFLTGDIAFARIYERAVTPFEAKVIYDGIFGLQGAALATGSEIAGKGDPLKRRIIRGPIPANIPGRHWVGEDSDWFTARNWSRSAGGVRGAGVPDCVNPVLFDAERPVYPEDY